jgi:SHS2 domain-containing protein
MKKFEFPDITTADVAFIAYGKDLNEVFENSALAMSEVMVNTKDVKPVIEKNISAKGIDLKSLLFNFLNEILVLVDSEGIVFSKFNVRVDEKSLTLDASCFGEKVNEKMETKTEVKAATYHKMIMEKDHKTKTWKSQVILDI